jgi:hypothetical protein
VTETLRPTNVTDADLVDAVFDGLRNRLPGNWDAQLAYGDATWQGTRDASIRIEAPDGTTARLLVEAKVVIDPRDVRPLTDAWRAADDSPLALLVVARYLAPRVRELIVAQGASYADITGNMRIAIDRPGLLIETTGASANPWREEREIKTLRGAPAARVIRAVCDFGDATSALELARRAATSVGSTYRILDLLAREALIEREGSKVEATAWPDLIRRWSVDYGVLRTNASAGFIEPRGIQQLLEKLRARTPASGTSLAGYTVTGSVAAASVAPFAEPRLAMVYVDRIRDAASALGLSPTESGANVILIEPFDRVQVERTRVENGIAYCALPQVVADLLTGPGRAPAEAEELVRWMESNEPLWRR